MANWKTDGELEDISVQTAAIIIEAFQNEDLDTGKQIGGDQSGLTDVMTSFASDYTTLDPAALAQEYERVRNIANATSTSGSIYDDLDVVHKFLASWHGDASDEFDKQITRIGSFMDSQSGHMARALQGIDSAYVANVTARQSYFDICQATIEAAHAAIADYDAKENKAAISALTEIPKAIFDASVGRSLTSTVGAIFTIGQKSYDLLSLSGNAEEVLNSYGKHVGELMDSYQQTLDGIAEKIYDASGSMRGEKIELLTPLPAEYADIHSPDFSYENFFSGERDPDSFGSDVDKEAEDTPEDEDEEESDITRALDGEGEKPGD